MRIQRLAHMYTLRILLVVCDVNDHQPAIRELTKVALVNQIVMIVAWSAEEAAHYLEIYKAFEQKPPDMIRAKVGDDSLSVLQSVLTNVRGINKTDVLTLSTRYHTFRDIVHESSENLFMLPGMGDTKARNLTRAFRQPFRTDAPRPYSDTEAHVPLSEHSKALEAETPSNAAQPSGLDSLPENFESLPEEEQLRIAMQLSME